LGSPVGVFMLRKGDLWDPAKTGERFGKIRNPIPDSSRKWLNFWDRQDILAYPLKNLFLRNPKNAERPLEDVEVQTGDLVINSHLGYWKNDRVAQQIAAALAAPI